VKEVAFGPEAVLRRRQELQTNLKSLLKDMHKTLQSTASVTEWNQESVQQLFRVTAALHSFLLASASAIGECRLAKPYAPLKPVIDDQGHFKWCCEHNPEHCS